MRVIIQGRHLRLSEGLKSYTQAHVVAPLSRFYANEAAELRVELGAINGRKRGVDMECHLTLHMPGAPAIQIEETTTSPYTSLDAAGERLVRAAKKQLSRMRRPGSRRREHPLALAVAEGGVPGGLVEDLPNGTPTGAHPRRSRQ
jgi:ribosome-associated translation inhibitor RaiA